MQLRNLKPSLTSLPKDQQLSLHEGIRQSRMKVKQAKTKAKEKEREDRKKVRKELQDPEKIRELLKMLGEIV